MACFSSIYGQIKFPNMLLPDEYTEGEPFRKTVSVKTSQIGQFHAVAFWFTLHIDENTSLSTGADGEMIHWGQSLYFIKNDKAVKAGEKVDITILQSETNIRFE